MVIWDINIGMLYHQEWYEPLKLQNKHKFVGMTGSP